MRAERADEATGRVAMRGQRFEVTVGPVAHGGFCVARHEGQVVFVRHALPGERVIVAVTEGALGDRFLRADAVDVLDAAPGRVSPSCPIAGPGLCGGCDWQHASLPTQRELKAAVVEEQLRRLAGIERQVVVEAIPDVAGAAPGFGWRSRVRYAATPDGRLGFRRSRSHQVVPVENCPLATDGVRETGVTDARWPATVAEVEVIAASGDDRLLMLTPRRRGQRVSAPELARPVGLAVDMGHGGYQRIGGRAHVSETAAGHTWRVSGSGFWQVHPAAADTLVDAVLAGLDPRAGEHALDLYSGVGLFAGALAERVGSTGTVLALESDPGAVADARHNLRRWPWARVERGRVDRALASAAVRAVRPDLVVLDPPRSGAGRSVSEALAGLSPRRVAYVACDPATLARDLGYLAAVGYRLQSLRAFDLFPMTHHVECVAMLEPTRT